MPLVTRRRFLQATAAGVASGGFISAGAELSGSPAITLSAPPLHPAEVRDDMVTVRPTDSGAALVNPGMGWMLYYYDDSTRAYGCNLKPDDLLTDFPGLSVVYFRVPWSIIEPNEGDFRWSILDGATQHWIGDRRRIALRFTCTETGPKYAYATPRWVKDAGARGHFFVAGKGIVPNGTDWEPDYNDPVFLSKLSNFLQVAAQRYDGDSSVDFIDVGSFGVWEEGHNFWSSKLNYDAETVERHIDLYRRHFTKTLLVANDDFADHGRGATALEYAYKHGLTLRDDSILVEPGDQAYSSAPYAQTFWPQTPVILETEHYGPSKERGSWQDGSRFLDAVEDYHASYASIHWWPHKFLAANQDLIRRINLRLGYRIVVDKLSWPERIGVTDNEIFSFSVRNAGVAPVYQGGFVALTLKTSDGSIAAVFTDERTDLRMLPTGAPGKSQALKGSIAIHLPPDIRAGEYQLFLSAGSRIGTPAYELPLSGGDGRQRYHVGKIVVTRDGTGRC